ncbi:MAG TPA: LysR family transcriptional regulator [Rhizomicrobium sp.]|nr:LysR family transcriptional regulator [Rhizomicrobium sp.]
MKNHTSSQSQDVHFSDERGVLYGEQALQSARKGPPDWESIHISLEVIRKGSFRAAAEHLGTSINVLRRRVDELERSLGVKLLTRHVDGVRVTSEGEKIFEAAKKMETASYELIKAGEQTNIHLSGEVRLAVTEGLGTFWIAPSLVEFQRANPSLLVDLHCAMKSADVLRLEADVAIQITRPTVPDLRMIKLGRLHFMFFASPNYIETFGHPKNAADLVNHRILVQSDDNVQWRALYDRLFPGVPASSLVALRTNVSSAHYWSIAKGGGIGVLPTYARWIGAPLVPLDLDIHEYTDIWLTYHPDARNIPRVARLIEWVIQSFSPEKFPWFRDEFIHPLKLAEHYPSDMLASLRSAFPNNRS